MDSHQCSRLYLRIFDTRCDQHPAGHPNGTHGGDHHPARLRRDHGQCAAGRTSCLSGTWTLTRTPGGTTTGSGTSTSPSTGLAAGTYTWTVTNAAGCISGSSTPAVINTPPVTPTAPTVGTITQPACGETTGSVPLSGLPASGSLDPDKNPGRNHHHRHRAQASPSPDCPGNLYLDSHQCRWVYLRILHTCCDQHPAGHPNGTHGGYHHPARLRRDHGQCAAERTSCFGHLDPDKNPGRDHHRLRHNVQRNRTCYRKLYLDSHQCGWLHLGSRHRL